MNWTAVFNILGMLMIFPYIYLEQDRIFFLSACVGFGVLIGNTLYHIVYNLEG